MAFFLLYVTIIAFISFDNARPNPNARSGSSGCSWAEVEQIAGEAKHDNSNADDMCSSSLDDDHSEAQSSYPSLQQTPSSEVLWHGPYIRTDSNGQRAAGPAAYYQGSQGQ